MDSTAQQCALVGFGATFLAIQLAVTVATYRVSRHRSPFVIFLSEMLINTYSLATELAMDVEKLFSFELSANGRVEWDIARLLTYTSVAFNLLVAVNRGCSIVLPLYYERLWTRRVTVGAVLATWALGSALRLYAFIADGFASTVPTTFMTIYIHLQYWTTCSSLAVYALTLIWVVIKRQVYQRTVLRLRVFVYCFLSFLPTCYFIFVRPEPGFYFSLFIMCRLAINGCLLLVLSSLVRQNVPGHRHLARLFKWCNGESTGRSNAVKQQQSPLVANATEDGVRRVGKEHIDGYRINVMNEDDF